MRGRGGLDVMGEGSVDEINKEGRGKKGNPFILWCGGGEWIKATREGIGSHEVRSQNMNHGEVEIC